MTKNDKTFIPCHRCGGTGYTAFVNVANGICFACEGAKGRWVDTAAAERRERDRARREAKKAAARAARLAEMDTRWDALTAADATVAEALLALSSAEVAVTGYAGPAGEIVANVRDGRTSPAEAIAQYAELPARYTRTGLVPRAEDGREVARHLERLVEDLPEPATYEAARQQHAFESERYSAWLR